MTRFMHVVINRDESGYFTQTNVTFYAPDGTMYEGSGYSLVAAMSEVATALDKLDGIVDEEEEDD